MKILQKKLDNVLEKSQVIIKFLALILLILFFVPTSVVSCSGSKDDEFYLEISPFDLAIGDLDYNFELDEADSYLEDIDAHIELFLMPVFSILMCLSGVETPLRSMIYSFLNIILIMMTHYTYIEEPVLESEYGYFLTIETTFAYDLYIFINVILLIWFTAAFILFLIECGAVIFFSKCECGAKLKLTADYCPNCGKKLHNTSEKSQKTEEAKNINNNSINSNTNTQDPEDNQ